MTAWELPPKAKIYEALTAVADGRVRLTGATTAEVTSSSGDATYTVTWSPDGLAFSANDNASYWAKYAGYPIVAVLLVTGRISYDAAVAGQLAGIPWKRLNEASRRDYDRAVDVALRAVEERGGDRDAVAAQVDAIVAQLAGLGLQRGPRLAPARRRAEARRGDTGEDV